MHIHIHAHMYTYCTYMWSEVASSGSIQYCPTYLEVQNKSTAGNEGRGGEGRGGEGRGGEGRGGEGRGGEKRRKGREVRRIKGEVRR